MGEIAAGLKPRPSGLPELRYMNLPPIVPLSLQLRRQRTASSQLNSVLFEATRVVAVQNGLPLLRLFHVLF